MPDGSLVKRAPTGINTASKNAAQSDPSQSTTHKEAQSAYTHSHTHAHTYIHSFIHPFVHLFIHSFIHSFIRSLIYAFIHSFIHSFTHACIHTYKCGDASDDSAGCSEGECLDAVEKAYEGFLKQMACHAPTLDTCLDKREAFGTLLVPSNCGPGDWKRS